MSNDLYKEYNRQYNFAKRLLKAVENSQIQLKTVTKITKPQLIKFLEAIISNLNSTRSIVKDCEINLVDEFTDMNTNAPVELPTSDGQTIRILTKEQVEKMEIEVEEIEKYYPGENALTKQEKICRKSFNSLHDYQYFISQVRKGTSDIIKNGDGSITLVFTE